jgi:N6-adenosine-specific RNA methylase IME4/DNA-binding XRE family transcriptional regulator
MEIQPWKEICDLIPPLSAAERKRLLASLLKQHVDIPVITMADGRIIDGHHRWELAPDKCRIEILDIGEAEAFDLAVQLNIARRNLSPEQLQPLIGFLRGQGKTQAAVAEAVGVSQKTVSNVENTSDSKNTNACIDQRVSVPKQAYSAIAERVRSGEPQAQIAADHHITQQRVSQIATLVESRANVPDPVTGEVPMPDQKFRCIVIDPPWPMQKIEREKYPNQSQTLDYPVMSLDEISSLPIGELADPAGCHLYLWVTQKFLPSGFCLFDNWGVKYQCLLTWVKPSGFTPFSWMYNTEHVLFGRIGSLPLDKLGLKLSFDAPVTRHSAKPDVFYDRVIQASPGPRLEMFSRQRRDGFTCWGNEVQE